MALEGLSGIPAARAVRDKGGDVPVEVSLGIGCCHGGDASSDHDMPTVRRKNVPGSSAERLDEC